MLKQIELYGFKSFAEKTILNFDDEINGIVGPNGSGKSNIVDAIKWCLGEQSLKEIRAKTPLDVIFNGSESKPPSNWCEVTLVFDNSKGTFPVDYQEVAITRRIYRNGETEYFINRVPCRLKDIKELILDTGLSPDGYAIIPQGKVEFVVSAKPEERRLLFEETAGIAKYKLKREETLRKLERVKLDMARVEDILAYLKEQMASLEQAVKKAKNYNKYKQELQMLECAYAIIQVESINTQLSETEQTYQQKSIEYAEVVSKITSQESEIAELKLKILDLEKEFLKLKDEDANCEKEISVCTQKIENLKNELSNFDVSIEKLKKEIEELNNRNKNYSEEILQLEQKKNSVLEVLKQQETDKLAYQQEYEIYRKQISEGQELVKDKNKLLSEIVYKRTKLRNDIVNLSREIQKVSVDKAASEKEIHANQKNKTLAEEELTKINQQIFECENQKTKLEQELAHLNELTQKLQEELKGKQSSYEVKNQEFYNKTSLIDKLSGTASLQSYDFQKLFYLLEKHNLQNICVPVSTIVDIKPEYYDIVVSYLGNKLYWLVTETEEDARKVITILKQEKLGYATFVVKERVEQVLGLTLDSSVSNLISYEPRWEKIVKFLFSDLVYENGELKNAIIIHTGDRISDDATAVDILKLKQEVHLLSEELKNLSNEIQQLTIQLDEHVLRKTQIEKDLVSIETQLRQLYETKKQKEDYLNSIVELGTMLENNLSRLNSEYDLLQKQLEDLNTELKLLDEQERQLREEINLLVQNVSQLQSNKVVEEYIRINSEYVRLQEQVSNLSNEIQTKTELVQLNEKKISSFIAEIAELEQLKISTIENIKCEETKLESLLAQKNMISEKLSSCLAVLEETRNILSTKEQEVKQLTEHKEILQQELASLEIRKTSMMNSKDNYINWMMDKYNLNFDEAKQLYGNIKEVDPQAIEKLKKKVESMSAVNLAAPEEYAQLEEKYNHLVTQQQDLLKSHQDLQEAIKKINQQISNDFKETFAKVRENFIKLCNILFEGGKADLVLTDENNVLESGIEIFVQPPGKRLQNINLLSGGEKSLVAFALLFAFFMVRPSPVCILDEADAQLDETNVVRFMKLLKDFSQNTKFILITHNTRTMEFIDTLYGVTMEELGVSKIIAVKLQRAEVAV